MASFWFKSQIFVSLPSKKQYNLILRQQPWHYVKTIFYSKKVVCDDAHDRSACPSKDKQIGSRRRIFWIFQRKLRPKRKSKINCREQRCADRLSFWEFIFGFSRKCKTKLTVSQRQKIKAKTDSQVLEPCYQAAAQHMLIYSMPMRVTKASRIREPQPKSPPGYKEPTAVLLNNMMLRGFHLMDRKCKVAKPTAFRKPYDEMKPPADMKTMCRYERCEPENTESCRENPAKIVDYRRISTRDMEATGDSTIQILRQAMEQEEPQIRSRIEQLKLLVDKKNSQYAPSRTNSKSLSDFQLGDPNK